MNRRVAALGAALFVAAAATPAYSAEMIRPVSQRYASDETTDTPDFQRHVLPLMGRLGCNGRACHGSFQGAGGFRLSLFGYDFKMDHEALMKADAHRVDTDNADASKILQKPILAIPHKGGKRMEEESWQYRLLLRWVETGAKPAEGTARFEKLEITPTEIVFEREGQQVPLKVIAHWSDGDTEDVTCIARFRTNDESIAEVDADGLVTCKGKGDTHIVAFYDNGVGVTQVIRPLSDQIGPKYPAVPTPTKIDELVLNKLRKLGVVPSAVCSDSEFLRRVSLDLTGTLPTPAEVESFLADNAPQKEKRAKKVEELLARPTYAAWWTNRLCDITGNTPRNFAGQIPSAVNKISQNWYAWIFNRVRDNVPYDKLIAGIVLGTSRRPGQSYEDYIKEETSYYRDKDPADFTTRETMPYFWAKRNIRLPEEKALSFSYTFLGVRLECAQCHKHPFDQWTQDDFKQFMAFFGPVGYGTAPDSRQTVNKMRTDLGLNKKMGGDVQRALAALVKEGKTVPWQEVFVNTNGMPARSQGTKKQVIQKTGRVPKLLGGEQVKLTAGDDPRAPLVEWMRRKDNPYFARAFINRVWAVYFGSGIINPPDDMNLANPPSNEALLNALSEGFIAHDFDMKWLHREILASETYQRSWETNDTNQYDERNFSRAVVRRLPAEVLLDAMLQATAGSSKLAEAPASTEERAIGMKGNTQGGRRGANTFAATVFGRSTRQTNCDCSASNEPNLLQSIFLQNDQDVLGAIDRRDGWLVERTGDLAKLRQQKAKLAGAALEVIGLSKQIARLEKRLKEAKSERETKSLDDQLKTLRAQLASKETQVKDAEQAEKDATARAFEPDSIVREAYLRVLSRRPNDHESEMARKYLTEASEPAKGMRDLLWALLNTKEFITNH